MHKKRNELLLLVTALIWGVAFVAQSAGGDAVGAYTFNCIRLLIGALVLLPAIRFLDHLGLGKKPQTREEKKTLLRGGISCGIILALAGNLQQIGINLGTPAGKAGFLTACYIIIVPVLGLFLKKKPGIRVWIGVALTVIGLYLLCMSGQRGILRSDFLLVLCALVFSLHILVIDHFSPLVDGVRMSCIQFFVAGLISLVPTLLVDLRGMGFENWLAPILTADAWIPILYAGILSCGVAYTLQIIGQQNVDPTIASLLMSLESVFSVLAGWLLLGQALSLREIIGCVLIFAAIQLSTLGT